MSKLLNISLILCLFYFTSCSDVIFYKIDNEVKLEDAHIQGELHGIVRYTSSAGDFIYIDTGEVRFKSAMSQSNRDWAKQNAGLKPLEYDYYGTKFNGVQIIKVACDEDNLYALGVEWEVDEDEGENLPKRWVLYAAEGAFMPWVEIWSMQRAMYSMDRDYLMDRSVISLFCTNTYNKANRKAFLRVSTPNAFDYDASDTKIYELSGAVPPVEYSETPNYVIIPDLLNITLTHDAVFFNGKVYFLNYDGTRSAIGTDEVPGEDAKHIYYSMGNVLYYSTDGEIWLPSYPRTSNGIVSMALTKDYFILGTDGGGLFHVQNIDGVPIGQVESFSTNADIALGSPYKIRTLYCIDPTKTEAEASIFATADFSGTTTGSMDDVGLWSYYPSRGNWNRE